MAPAARSNALRENCAVTRGHPIDVVFLGSCTHSRLGDLRDALGPATVLVYNGSLDVASLREHDEDENDPHEKGHVWLAGQHVRVYYVTHWMPLPEPPKI